MITFAPAESFVADPRTIAERRSTARWPWWVAAGLFVQYSLVGTWLVKTKGYMIFDALNRTVTAQIMVMSRDPHLGAMGFYWPPLPMFLRVPFVLLLAPFDQAILSGPLASSLAAALVVPILARIGREVGANTAVTAVVVVVYALNPVTIFSAANAMSESAFALFLAVSLLGFVRFTTSRSVRDLSLLGLGLAGGMASRYEFIPLTIAAMVVVALFAPRPERRAAMAMVAIPPAFVFALWTLASSLIAGDGFLWYRLSRESGATPDDHPWMPADLTVTNVTLYVMKMVLLTAPAFVVVGVGGLAQRFGRRGWLGLLLLAGTLPVFLALQLIARTSYGTPRYFALMPFLATVASLWVIGRARQSGRRTLHVVLTGAAVLAGIGGALAATYAYTNFDRTRVERESVFFNSLVGKPDPEYPRFITDVEPIMDDLEPLLDDGLWVAMDSLNGVPVLLTSHPDRFIVPEDRDFAQIMSDPAGRFDLVLLLDVEQVGLSKTSYALTIEAAMNSIEGGRFVPIAEHGVATLYRFYSSEDIAAGAVPTTLPVTSP